jgi:hypothetical protein
MKFKMHEQNFDKGDFEPAVHDIKFNKETLKEVPPVAGLNRPLQGMERGKRRRQPRQEPPDAA